MHPRTLRFAVGTALVALGSACTSADKPTTSGTEQTVKPPEPPTHTVNEGPVGDPKNDPKPEPKPDPDGGCQPPDCHINPGPTKDPGEPVTKDPPPTKTPEPVTALPTANPGPR